MARLPVKMEAGLVAVDAFVLGDDRTLSFAFPLHIPVRDYETWPRRTLCQNRTLQSERISRWSSSPSSSKSLSSSSIRSCWSSGSMMRWVSTENRVEGNLGDMTGNLKVLPV